MLEINLRAASREKLSLGERVHLSVFHFTKGNNFCDFPSVSLDEKAFTKSYLLAKERTFSKRNTFFFNRPVLEINFFCG